MYYLSFPKYAEFKAAAAALISMGKITSPKDAVFVPMDTAQRKWKLRGAGQAIPKSHLIGFFTPTEISKLTQDAPIEESDSAHELQQMYEQHLKLIDRIISTMPLEWVHGLRQLREVFVRDMEKAVASGNILDAYQATRYLERQISILQVNYREYQKNLHSSSNK